MISSNIEKMIAKALFEVLIESQMNDDHDIKLKEYFDNLSKINLLLKDKEIMAFVNNRLIKKSKRKEFVENFSENKYILNLLKYFVDENIIDHFEKIYNQFKIFYQKHTGYKFIEVITKDKIHDEAKKKLIFFFNAKYKKNKIDFIYDSKLLGGIIIKINNNIFDYSYNGELKRLEEYLGG